MLPEDSTTTEGACEAWLLSFVANLQARLAGASAELGQDASGILHAPFQVEVFEFCAPAGPVREVVGFLTHFEETLGGPQVAYHGPFTISQARLHVPDILSAPKWKEVLPSGSPFLPAATTYGDVAENQIAGAIRVLQESVESWMLGRYIPGPWPDLWNPFFYEKHRLNDRDRIFLGAEALTTRRPADVASEVIASELPTASDEGPRPARTTLTNIVTLRGAAAFVFPPIWIGDRPALSFADRITGAFPVGFRDILDVPLGNCRFVLREDGLLLLGEEDQQTALSILNGFMGLLLLAGVPCEAVQFRELGEASVRSAGPFVGSGLRSWRTPTLRNLGMEPHGQERLCAEFATRRYLDEGQLRATLRLGARLLAESRSRELLARCSEAWTHFERTEYTQAFLLAWMLLEREIGDFWTAFLDERRVGGKRRRRLADSNAQWSASSQVQVLELAGFLRAEDYDVLDSLRAQRNKIVHDLRRADKEQAARCVETAIAYVRRRLGPVPTIDTK